MLRFENPLVAEVFANYPEHVRPRMHALRDLIFTTAEASANIGKVTETLKWGEPSYLCKSGSTLRIHWKESDSEVCRMFFHCQTKLVPTFRELFSDELEFEGNRAIKFSIEDEPDLRIISTCIEASLNYHALKKLPSLGLKEAA